MWTKGQFHEDIHQKTVIPGSKEEIFNPENLWKGLSNEITTEDPYFYSYSQYGIHEEMIKDKSRTEAYMNAITQNSHLFYNKIVLDVGCGTGILSIFASRAGAKHVYGIEAADIAAQASEIIAENSLSEKITILRGKVEEIELPVEKVDIIISEWMGYFLLYECMLETIIYARNKWLSPGGLIFPNIARMFVSGIEDADYKERKIEYWDNVYGTDMGIIKTLVMADPIIDVVDSTAVVTTEYLLFTIDLSTVSLEELDFAGSYKLTAIRTDYLHAIIAYFEVEFSYGNRKIVLSTSPARKATHWKQTVFYFEGAIPMNCGEEIEGSVAIRRNTRYKREIDVKISYHFSGLKTNFDEVRFYKIR